MAARNAATAYEAMTLLGDPGRAASDLSLWLIVTNREAGTPNAEPRTEPEHERSSSENREA